MYTINSKGQMLAHFVEVKTQVGTSGTMLVRTGTDADPDPKDVVRDGWCLLATPRNATSSGVKWKTPDIDAPIEDNIERLVDELINLGFEKGSDGRWRPIK